MEKLSGNAAGAMQANSRLGLCLSGGGFRAALFQIGTLAALAERSLLHRVEVLSTVSGGSIIGAYFYLKVKQLLEGRRPGVAKAEPEHYGDIVREIEVEFLAAVQRNMRLRLLLNPYKTARMLLEEEYTRSDRMADLLDSNFYNFLALKDGLRLEEIHITPSAINRAASGPGPGAFSLRQHNADAEIKIPVLTINTTCLNTGHPFHFTGSWMGEPSRNGRYQREQNSNFVLPQLRFDGTYQDDRSKRVEDWQLQTMRRIKLAHAVAASAGVPGIFPPLPIHGLYRSGSGDEIVVELADGGVFDNQGLDALEDAQCTHVVVSDAGGQMEDECLLPTDAARTAGRANSVMMDRIRGYGYEMLERDYGGSAKAAVFTHLRELATNQAELPAIPGPGNKSGGLIYRLSGLRTDLDAFNDLEAHALMYQGYALAHDKLGSSGFATPQVRKAEPPWRFLSIAGVLTDPAGLNRLSAQLICGKNQFFKTFSLRPLASWAWLLLLLSPLLAWSGYWLYQHWGTEVVLPDPGKTWGQLALMAVAALVGISPMSSTVRTWFKSKGLPRLVKNNRATDLASTLLVPVAMAAAAIAAVLIFLWLSIYDRIYLKAGSMPKP